MQVRPRPPIGQKQRRPMDGAQFHLPWVGLAGGGLKSVAPSHPFRDKTCEMDGARCFYLGGESIRTAPSRGAGRGCLNRGRSLRKSNDEERDFAICNRGHIFDCQRAFPGCLEKKDKSHLPIVGVGYLGLEFEYSSRMAKDQQAGAADVHRAVERGSNARIADVPAQSVERFSPRDKIDIETRCNAARPVFKSADAARVYRHCGSLSGLDLARHALVSIGGCAPEFQYNVILRMKDHYARAGAGFLCPVQ